MNQLYIYVECLFQFFNTHGTEITPGSDVVGKNLKRDRLGHGHFSCDERHKFSWRNNATGATFGQPVPGIINVSDSPLEGAKFTQIQS